MTFVPELVRRLVQFVLVDDYYSRQRHRTRSMHQSGNFVREHVGLDASAIGTLYEHLLAGEVNNHTENVFESSSI